MNKLVLSSLIIITLSVFNSINAFADQAIPSNHLLIAVKDSNVCEILLKNHLPNSCLPYDQLKVVDNTNPQWSGLWTSDSWYHRLSPKVTNHYNFNPNKNIIMVDPNNDFITKAVTVTVIDKNFTFINPNEMVGNNHTRTEYYNKAVIDCKTATVSPNIQYVKQVILYIEGGCKDSSYLDSKTFKTGNKDFILTSPYSSLKLDTYLKNIFHEHKFFSSVNRTNAGGLGPVNCINHQCSFTDPYKKAGY